MNRVFMVVGIVCLLALLLPACAEQPEPEAAPEPEVAQEVEKIPVTTSSETARELYQEGMSALDEVLFTDARERFDQAIEDDPDFFMAYYRRAMIELWFGTPEGFREYAEKGLAANVELSPGEELMKNALATFLEDPKGDATEFGRQLVETYPNDVDAYYSLNLYQGRIEDYQGAAETLKQALTVADDPAPIYNILAYRHMSLEQWDEAKAALDKYVELKPEWSNPYDSLGDYYMNVEDYEKAYESFMKAAELGRTSSEEKSMKAQEMMAAEKPTT